MSEPVSFNEDEEELCQGQPLTYSDSEPVLRGPGPAKRPRPALEESEELLPELSDFFDDFETPLQQRVAICRAYASYIVSLSKKPKRNKK